MTEGMEQWDLTSKISPYLDRHMMFPLLEFVDGLIKEGKFGYNSKDVAAARLALLKPTHMVDYAIDIHKSLEGGAVPKEMEEKKATTLKTLEELQNGCKALHELNSNAEEKSKLLAAGKWNVGALGQHKITPEVVETYRQHAKFKFECGDYKGSRDMLEVYISLFAKAPKPSNSAEDDQILAYAHSSKSAQSNNEKGETGDPNIYYLTTINENILQTVWGKLACEILVEDWEAASVAVDAVKASIETMASNKNNNKQTMSPLKALSQRTWLLHWALFVYWNNSAKGGLEQLVELFHTERYKQAITTNAPHLSRYLTAAVLLCKRRMIKKAGGSSSADGRRVMKNLINVMSDCEHTDPIVEFVNCLCVKFDFESAQTKLAECENVLASDFFLCQQTALFMEEARVFVFENYCRIHNKIDLGALGTKLAMNQEEAERWIVDLIRNADLDAKIDSEEGCVVMGGSVQSIYEQVMERTRDLNVRSATLTQNLNAVIKEARKEKKKKEKAAREAD